MEICGGMCRCFVVALTNYFPVFTTFDLFGRRDCFITGVIYRRQFHIFG